jgi:class 3 adenylate cyclase
MSEQPVPRRRLLPNGFGSIQSKLLLMLLVSSILSAAVVGLFGYHSGTKALQDSAYARLTEVRNERLISIRDFLDNQRGAVLLDSQGVGVDASKAFNAGFNDLARSHISTKQSSALQSYYADDFVPKLKENIGGDLSADAFVPDGPAERYLQANYTAPPGDFDAKIKVDDAGDGSAWTKANKKFNPYFRSAALSLGLDDVLMLDNEGNVVYSAYKGSELGANVTSSQFDGGGLEKVFTAATRSNSRDFVGVADFEQYTPSYGDPTMFIASPIGTEDDLTGVLVYEVSAEKINAVMSGTAAANKFSGLGKTGETYLVGPDSTLRSDSRELLSGPKQFTKDAVNQGADPTLIKRIVRTKDAMLLLPDGSAAAKLAGHGQSGTSVGTDYLGHKVLTAYAPAKLDGLDWSILATIHTSEALGPSRDFARNILLATAGIALLVTAGSVLMSRAFTSPLNRLLKGVRAVAGGELGTRVDAGSTDEFGDLAVAFNDMSAGLASRQELLEAQQAENDRILQSLMPAPVVKRYRGGETDISEEHHNVSVVFTDIEGFDAFADKLPAGDALVLLNALSRGFDEAAAKVGIEKVRSDGTSYVASSGLVVQRVDHVRRVVDFAVEVAGMVERFNVQQGTKLIMRAGVDTGDVRSGLVGGGDVVYNLWGDAVSLAHRIRTAAGEAGIYVTDAVKERLAGAYAFEQVGTVTADGAEKPVWRLQREGAS